MYHHRVAPHCCYKQGCGTKRHCAAQPLMHACLLSSSLRRLRLHAADGRLQLWQHLEQVTHQAVVGQLLQRTRGRRQGRQRTGRSVVMQQSKAAAQAAAQSRAAPPSCLEDGCVRVVVDGHNHLAILHPRNVLDGTADANSNVQLRRHHLARLADLQSAMGSSSRQAPE